MVNQEPKIRNPAFVFIMPVLGIILISTSRWLPNVPEFIFFLGFALLTYPIYWLYRAGEQVKPHYEAINPLVIPAIFFIEIMGLLIGVIVGAHIFTATQSQFYAYLPIIILSVIMLIWLIVYLVKLSKGIEKATGKEANPFLSFLLLLMLIPAGMSYVQKYLNRMIHGAFGSNDITGKKEDQEVTGQAPAEDAIKKYIEQYKNQYTKAQLKASIKKYYMLTDTEADNYLRELK